ncbi:MAG: hypothetical protein Q4D79_11955 [Propionibacteriaceae bacterium]|nr:hypothetical protein [Propionibacteriaceae bacterium]
MYFRLKSDVYLVEGGATSALYDGGRQRVFLLEADRAKTLQLAEQNVSLEDVATEMGLSLDAILNWTEELRIEELGDYLDHPAFVEKVNHFPRWQSEHVFQGPPDISTGFLVVSAPCDLNCVYCTDEDVDLHLSCWRCVRGSEVDEWDFVKLKSAIEKYRNLGVGQLCIVVPPKVDVSRILVPLVDEAKRHGFRPEIVSDLSLVNSPDYIISPEDVTLRLKVDLNRYSAMSLNQSISRVPTDSRIILIGDDPGFLEVARGMLRVLGIDWVETSAVSPSTLRVEHKLSYPLPDARTLNYRQRLNGCLASTLTVHSDGLVSTCPMLRAYPLAEDFDIVRALRSDEFRLQKGLSMGLIEPCCSCGIRYACADCRYIEIRAGADLYQSVTCTRLTEGE